MGRGRYGGTFAPAMCAGLVLCAVAAVPAAARPPASSYSQDFEPRGLRLDLFHTGTATDEAYALAAWREEPAWGGPFGHRVDLPVYGKHQVQVIDRATGRLLYRAGYSSLFSEWQTTDEAKSRTPQGLEESVRVPWPRRPVRIVVESRNREGAFGEVFQAEFDPATTPVDRTRRFAEVPVDEVAVPASPDRAVDLLIVGDGYADGEAEKFRRDARRFSRVLLETPPFDGLRDRIAVRAVRAPSRDSGPSEPRRGRFLDTGAGSSFNTFGSARYLMTAREHDLRALAARAPYDALVILVNSSRYGGGGIYGQYATFVSDSDYSEYIFVHELGHSFAGLGDEYYTSSVAYSDFYPRGVEPWEPNITALLPGRPLKWGGLVTPRTPVPTPTSAGGGGDTVGAFEGAGYAAKGLYRPSTDCKMFSKGNVGFCRVCKDAVVTMVKLLTE